MELCVNYTSEIKQLFEEGKIDFIDYFKLYSINGDLSPIEWCINNKKLMFHGLVGHGANIASKNFLNDRNWAMQKDYIERGRCPYVSFHINVDSGEETASEAEMMNTIKNNIKEVRKVLDYDILLENVPAKIGNQARILLASSDFICKVIEETDTYFLLDIAHAKAAAQVLNIPFIKYIDSLPLNKVREVHLSGCVKRDDGTIVANHSEMKDDDYILLEHLLNECENLKVLTLEYGPFDKDTGKVIPTYDKIDSRMKSIVYENLLKLKSIIGKYN